MRPLAGVRNYRKKMRNYRRRCRQPTAEMKIGLFILRMECQSAGPTLKKPRLRTFRPASSQRSARLESLCASLLARRSMIHVPISAWRTGRTDLAHLIKNPPSQPGSPKAVMPPNSPGRPAAAPPAMPPGSPVGGMRVKSELKMVTETCTSIVSTPPRQNNKVCTDLLLNQPPILNRFLYIYMNMITTALNHGSSSFGIFHKSSLV